MTGPWLSSKRLNGILIVLAASGWMLALSPNPSDTASDSPVLDDSSSQRAKSHERQVLSNLSMASLVSSSSRSARLFARLDDIAEAGTDGEANPLFLDACDETLDETDYIRRSRDFGILLELMRPEDAALIHERFVELHRQGRPFGEEYAAFATRWGEIDPEGALGYFLDEDPVRLPAHDMEKIARSWGHRDPMAALEWMQEHPEIAASRGGWSAAVKGWFRMDADAATAFLLEGNLSPDQTIETIRYGFVERIYDGGLNDAVGWLAGLPDEAVANQAAIRAWNDTLPRLSQLSPEEAAGAWSAIGGRPWVGFDQLQHFTHLMTNATANPDGTLGFTRALVEQWPPERAAENFVRWHQADPAAVEQWLQHVPDGNWKEVIETSISEG